MERIYKAVLVHAQNNPNTDKIELAVYLNNTRDFDINVGGLAINTIIRQTYNHYIRKKEFKNAFLILEIYQPEVFKWKVLNKYGFKK